jgi:NADPH2:quinone reductase
LKAIWLERTGAPDVLRTVDRPVPTPGRMDVLVEARAIGVSRPEVMVRNGTYAWMPALPCIPGIEMAGVVAQAGADVTHLKVGDPVFVSARELATRGGCYAQCIAVPAQAVQPLPAGIDLRHAACLSNYQVAWHLLHSAPAGMAFTRVLVTGAAGGIGSALVQLARLAGKTVVGLARSAERCRFVESLGAVAVDARDASFPAQVLRATDGEGAGLVLDAVGGERFMDLLDCVAPMGLLVSYAQLGGPIPGDLIRAMRGHRANSPAVRCFTMHAFDRFPEHRAEATRQLVAHLARGDFVPPIHAVLPLQEAARAHALLEGGAVLGKVLLQP